VRVLGATRHGSRPAKLPPLARMAGRQEGRTQKGRHRVRKVDSDEAREILDAELAGFDRRSYDELVSLIGTQRRQERSKDARAGDTNSRLLSCGTLTKAGMSA